ncbi:helix-turn-helix transcriptional regulator [Rhodoblastus sp.]|jgi:transcriptional regulator with XRE-family HTH domain|uniref:helix-turn-helix domain-containing protein n=1 Tax=Rhodoblastus sp. TaxID=1962975 RepID=UPI00262DF4A2|nr:helix-turn-helix transcriptional regulator [Rhodoblastus sp.]
MASFYPDLYEAALRLLIEARRRAGLSQEALAERFRMAAAWVKSFENGRWLLDPAEFIAICRAIGVDPYELLRKAEEGGGES